VAGVPPNMEEITMTKFTLLAIVAILPALASRPASAMAAIQEPGAYAFAYPNADLGTGSSVHRTRVASHRVASHKALGAFALAPDATRHPRRHR
jgi:hypothetical protein